MSDSLKMPKPYKMRLSYEASGTRIKAKSKSVWTELDTRLRRKPKEESVRLSVRGYWVRSLFAVGK
jgi:hypothetical protein